MGVSFRWGVLRVVGGGTHTRATQLGFGTFRRLRPVMEAGRANDFQFDTLGFPFRGVPIMFNEEKLKNKQKTV